ncbi:MAG: VTT domain-containing protein [Candidatus Vogelbacteria bacterium]|nr:VTT domain-containing protein [Candidatus Vogelbacteria bacterium]
MSLVGMMLGDSLWYWLGRWLDDSRHVLARWASRVGRPFDHHLLTRSLHTILLSKFTYGIHHAILVRAGAMKQLLWFEFLRLDFISTAVWVCVIGALGYLSGASFALVKHYIKFAELASGFAVLLFLVFWHLLAKRTRKPIAD